MPLALGLAGVPAARGHDLSTLIKPVLLAIAFTVFLSGCDSPEERAEEHYRNGLALLQEGKLAQAGIEFRNALQENEGHGAARFEFAQVLEETGDTRGAIGQLMAVVQRDDKNGPAYLALARLAVGAGDFQSAATYARRAFELMPEDPAARALMASVEFREGDKNAGIKMAQGVLAEAPESVVARLVVVADRMQAQDFATALESADAGLALMPDSADLHLARLASLESEGDVQAVGRQLQDMVKRFPDNEGFRRALLQWYLDQNDVEGAVALMREIADRTPEDPTGYLNVAQLILQTSGPEAARQELQRLVETRQESAPFIQALAQLDFELGNRDAAIESLRKLAQGDGTSPEKRNMQITLARMLLQAGEQDEANALVDAVLKADNRHAGALKLRARRLIEEDAPEEALRDLSVADQEKPNDPETFTIMAAAHQREGAHEQAGQRLAQAVQASNFGREESARYARFLLADQRYSDVEGVLLDALGRSPNDIDLLTLLGQSYLQQQNWTRARQTAQTMAGLDDARAKNVARALELAALQRQGKTDEVLTELREAAAQSSDDIRPRLAVVEAMANSGDLPGAEAEARKVLEEFPEAQAARLLLANILSLEAKTAEAEKMYRDLIAEIPGFPAPYEGLASMLNRAGRADEASAALDAGIEGTNRASSLLNMKAELLILQEKFEEAIKLYEELYARDPSSVVIANNLATLLATHRDDAESLEQAFKAARRLRGSENPFYQDTYGWILTRRGDPEQAVAYLEPAAKALSGDPLTQYHLGITYFDLQRWEEAREALSRALEIAGEDTDLPQMKQARERIGEIAAAEANTAPGATGTRQ